MTKCITLNGHLINVGPWDYGQRIQVFLEDDYPHDFGAVIDGYWVQNPLPDEAIEEDIDLAWTAIGSIVKASSPLAVAPYSGG